MSKKILVTRDIVHLGTAYKVGDEPQPAHALRLLRSGCAAWLSLGGDPSNGEPQPTPQPAPTLDNLSYRELQRLAKERGIPVSRNKNALLAALA
jgi:5,10-methylenetetrahydrofolate reductase